MKGYGYIIDIIQRDPFVNFSYVDELETLLILHTPDVCMTCLNSICVWLTKVLKSCSKKLHKRIAGSRIFMDNGELVCILTDSKKSITKKLIIPSSVSRIEQKVSKYQNIQMTNNLSSNNIDVTYLLMCMNDQKSFQEQCVKFYEHSKIQNETKDFDSNYILGSIEGADGDEIFESYVDEGSEENSEENSEDNEESYENESNESQKKRYICDADKIKFI